MKIMSLNIGGYGFEAKSSEEWEIRKINLVNAVKIEKPDVLFLEEVVDNQKYQLADGLNQAQQLNKELNYEHSIYDVVEQIFGYGGRALDYQVFDSLLCLTNLDIIEHRLFRLKKVETDKHYRAVQIIKVIFLGKEVLFYHIHYSNKNDWSKLHLEETKNYFINKAENPIIVGDLNISNPAIIKEILGNNFQYSYDFKKYSSFPSKDEVLDYSIIPNGHYIFNEIKCGYDGCSDHRALITKINFIL